ncbi:MAG: hypothetical protein R2764_25940 [Bacteroidales bacterium]
MMVFQLFMILIILKITALHDVQYPTQSPISNEPDIYPELMTAAALDDDTIAERGNEDNGFTPYDYLWKNDVLTYV